MVGNTGEVSQKSRTRSEKVGTPEMKVPPKKNADDNDNVRRCDVSEDESNWIRRSSGTRTPPADDSVVDYPV